MTVAETSSQSPVPAPPRIVVISGMLFSIFFITTLVLIRVAAPVDPAEPGAWLLDPIKRRAVRLALSLIPFTGILFLWYMGVLRTRIGAKEDRFFSTVFLGSGLMFVSMLFTSAALAQGLMESFASPAHDPKQSEVFLVGRRAIFASLTTFGLKMASVFMFVTSTIGIRTGVLSRWVTFVGFGIAIVFLISLSDTPWLALLFPGWVMLVSVWILRQDMRSGGSSQPPAKSL